MVINRTAMETTAATIVDIVNRGNVANSSEILDLLRQRLGSVESFVPLIADIPLARYLTNHKQLEKIAQSHNGDLQVVELGSGFTPHALNVQSPIAKYVEVDLPQNSSLKSDIVGELNPTLAVSYIGGSILEPQTWSRVASQLDDEKPTYIFSEGLVSQYLSSEEKHSLATMMLPLLQTPASYFVTDDSFKYHPKLKSDQRIIAGMRDVVKTSQNTSYEQKSHFQMDEKLAWRNRFNGEMGISLVPYVQFESELDFALRELKLYVCRKPNVEE